MQFKCMHINYFAAHGFRFHVEINRQTKTRQENYKKEEAKAFTTTSSSLPLMDATLSLFSTGFCLIIMPERAEKPLHKQQKQKKQDYLSSLQLILKLSCMCVC